MQNFIDIAISQLNKYGEELCGDQVQVHRGSEKTLVVLSDGLGSGVKANILSTLTSQIAISMMREGAALDDVVQTVAGTLPICRERKIAYATLMVLEIDHATMQFRLFNYENPAPFYFKNGKNVPFQSKDVIFGDKKFIRYEGVMELDDFLMLISDGVWYAGMGVTYNFGWGWDNIAEFIENKLDGTINHTETVVNSVSSHTRKLYCGTPGDDASLVGIFNRRCRKAMVFTGPPLQMEDDARVVHKLMDFDGRRIVCGGTSSNIVARELGVNVSTRMDTLRENIPPVGSIPGVDLVTEGILTLNKTIETIKEVDGDYSLLPNDPNGAMLLALELLVADDVTFLVGQKINSYYQNPLLPMSVSIRKTLVDQLVDLLRGYDKLVRVEYY